MARPRPGKPPSLRPYMVSRPPPTADSQRSVSPTFSLSRALPTASCLTAIFDGGGVATNAIKHSLIREPKLLIVSFLRTDFIVLLGGLVCQDGEGRQGRGQLAFLAGSRRPTHAAIGRQEMIRQRDQVGSYFGK